MYLLKYEDKFNEIDFNSVNFNFRILSGDFQPQPLKCQIFMDNDFNNKIKTYEHQIANVNLPVNIILKNIKK